MGNTYFNIRGMKERRQALRNNATVHEKTLWEELKGKKLCGKKFRRQHSIGGYILDFYCHEKKLGIELDGLHHLTEETKEYDLIRTEYISGAGVDILRFLNSEIENDITTVLDKIKGKLQ